MALSIFSVYLWSNYLAPDQSLHTLALTTILISLLSAAFAIIARSTVDMNGIFIRTVIGYLLLAAAVMLLLHDTGGVTSPYGFMWTFVAAFAGLFGGWSLPVFLAAAAYIGSLLIEGSLSSTDIASTALIAAVPIVFSLIVWSHLRQAAFKNERDPAAYKQLSDELRDLSQDESSGVIISAIGDGVLAIDSQGIVQLINPAALTMLGWTEQDALKLHYQSILRLSSETNQPLPNTTEPIKQSLNTNQESRSSHLQVETKSGKKLCVSIVVSPLGEAGSGVIVVLRDITKERAEERQQAEFISTASHEMRTPVASIEGYLGLALNPSTATIDDKARDFITKAHESAQHLGRLFQDLLDVSKAEDGRLSSNPTVINMVEYIGTVVDGLRQKAADKGLELIYKPAPQKGDRIIERHLSPVFYANLDKDHLREIISNLVENAIKYTPQGDVTVDITGDSQHITISIADSGIGIPAEDLPHLFQKFYRVDNSDTREIGGTGLGLYLCRRLAEALGGRIWAESVHKKGSTFFVELPRIDNLQAGRLKQAQAAVLTPNTTTVTEKEPQPNVQPTPPVVAPPQQSTTAPASVDVQRPTPRPAPQRVNTSLTNIEQNPSAYTVTRDTSVIIPKRNQ